MLKYRLIFGLIFIVVLMAVFYLDSQLAVGWPGEHWISPPGTVILGAWLVIIPFAMREMRLLLASDHVKISLRVTTIASMLCVAWPWVVQLGEPKAGGQQGPPTGNAFWTTIGERVHTVRPEYLVPTVLAAALIVALVYHTRNQKIEGAMANAGGSLFAIVYLGVLPSFYLPICLSRGSWMVLWVIAMVKAADIGAYTAGRLFGRHKLIPWLSPGKTIEGFFGGLAFSAGVGVLVAWLTPLVLWQGAIAGAVFGLVGMVGDLVESLFKRDAGVKDSGRVPGFGGILDLLDSPLLAAPVAYWLLKLVKGV